MKIFRELSFDENHGIAIVMSSSRADPVLGLNIQSYWAGRRDLNMQINATALAGGDLYMWLERFKYLNTPSQGSRIEYLIPAQGQHEKKTSQ